jgi:hypothetical protein
MSDEKPKEGDLQIWWIPQVPMESFNMPVASIEEATLLLKTLARYDLFQYENNVKPDYCNMGGLSIFENGEWTDWYHPDTGENVDSFLR